LHFTRRSPQTSKEQIDVLGGHNRECFHC
jgi:hypothetical protein